MTLTWFQGDRVSNAAAFDGSTLGSNNTSERRPPSALAARNSLQYSGNDDYDNLIPYWFQRQPVGAKDQIRAVACTPYDSGAAQEWKNHQVMAMVVVMRSLQDYAISRQARYAKKHLEVWK